MRLREDDCVGNGLVPEQHLLHLPRRDLLAAAVDDLLEAPAQEEVPVVVEIALVSRAKPPVAERLPVRVRVSLVACEDVRPANGNLADLAGREKQTIVVEHCDLRPCGAPDRAPLALVRRQRIDRHLVCGFGHSVRLEHGRVEEVFERVAHERRQRGRGGADESELLGRAPSARARSSTAMCIVGTAVYQVARHASSHDMNRSGSNPGVQTTVEPAATGANTDATRPWMWKSGMTARQRSSGVSSSERGDGASRSAEVPLGQRYELRSGCRARRVEEKRRLRPVRVLRPELDPGRPNGDEVEARVATRHEVQDAEAKAVGDDSHCCALRAWWDDDGGRA